MAVLFSLGCMIMGALAFGNEFQQNTLSLLLSQPIPRISFWKEKMFCLGIATAAVTSAAWLAFNLREKFQADVPWSLIFIPLCAFCGAPLWTLLSRSTLIGLLLSFLVPAFILGGNSLFNEDVMMWNDQQLKWYSGIALLAIYCGLTLWFGYSRFRTLQVLDAGSIVLGRELSIPSRLEALLLRPFRALAARFNGPFAALLKKELRLQQISFFLAGLFCLVAVLGGILYLGQLHLPADKRWALWIFTFDYAFYVAMLPLTAGALCVAEEKAWGLTEWHLTLPPSVMKQWITKILVALATSVGLGLLLPGILALVGEEMFNPSHSDSDFSLESILVFLTFMVGHLLLTSIVIYAACLCTNTIRAIVLALGMLLLGFFAVQITIAISARYDHFGLRAQLHLNDPLLVAIPLFILLCLVQWFAFISYRARKLTTLQLALQAVILIGSVCLLTFVFTNGNLGIAP